MAERRGFFSVLVGSRKKEESKEDKEKEERERFIEEVKEELDEKKGQKKIEHLLKLINREDEDENIRALRRLMSERLGEGAEATYHIAYDSFSEGLEPVYFWVVDFMRSMGFDVEKTKEDFYASVGSAFYGEMGQRTTKMQEQAMKMLATMNTIVRSIINLVYDLKEFDIRLDVYNDLHSDDAQKKEAAELAIKQIWMDQVDIKKGLGSINNMSQQLQFVTLRDAYMRANSLDDVRKGPEEGGMDLNERVKRILLMKLEEYFKWREYSENELRTRYKIEKEYLKSQVASLKLYAKWTKPYLLAAKKLDMNVADLSKANIVSVFNNMEIEIGLSGKKEAKLQNLINDKELPEKAKINEKYYQYIAVLFKFRSVPHTVQTPQGYQYRQGGRADIFFKAYGFSEKDLKEIKKSEEEEDYALIESTLSSLEAIRGDLEKYSAVEKKDEGKKEAGDEGPISALASGFKDILKPLKGIKIGGEGYFDVFVKDITKEKASGSAFIIYDVYKKAHGMLSF